VKGEPTRERQALTVVFNDVRAPTGMVEMRPGPVENAIDRIGGDYRNFEIPAKQDVEACKQACEAENRCRAWSYTRAGYGGPTAKCFLKDKITRPRRRPCCMSGVVR